MNQENNAPPPGRFWIIVQDLPSALKALELLIAYITSYTDTTFSCDYDEV